MIVKSYELGKFDFTNFDFFLIYGKNEGHQNEIINNNLNSNFKGLMSKYEENEFVKNFETISSEIRNRSLFDENKTIIISRVTEKILKFIEKLIEINIKDTKIILKCGILEKKSKIRNLFEKKKNLIIIPVYEDDDKTLSTIAFNFLRKNNIKLSGESVSLIIDRSNGSRENLNTELTKILNYSYSDKSLDYEKVKKLTNLSENYGANELADNYLAKNKKNISKILNENSYSDEDCILILRTILNKSKRLLDILERYEKIANLDEVISTTKPPIFWKDKDIVKNQVNMWEIDDLRENIYKINQVETTIKSNSKNSLNLVSDFIAN